MTDLFNQPASESADAAKPEKMTQKKAVMLSLEEKGSITSFEAFTDWGITRLAGIVYFLRKDGHTIIGEDVTAKNRFGHPVTYSRYTLQK